MVRTTVNDGKLRIIAGKWRGRKLPVLECDGLRPSSDRLRETLFNWLQSELVGKHCLDLFSGTGSLGFEAASRGAAVVDMVEKNLSVAQQLRGTRQVLDAQQCIIHHQSALDFLRSRQQCFDLVFLDPPFRTHLLEQVISLLDKLLHNAAWIYIEAEAEWLPVVPENWQQQRRKRMGQTVGRLFRRESGA